MERSEGTFVTELGRRGALPITHTTSSILRGHAYRHLSVLDPSTGKETLHQSRARVCMCQWTEKNAGHVSGITRSPAVSIVLFGNYRGHLFPRQGHPSSPITQLARRQQLRCSGTQGGRRKEIREADKTDRKICDAKNTTTTNKHKEGPSFN